MIGLVYSLKSKLDVTTLTLEKAIINPAKAGGTLHVVQG
jgi:hypothetical protein